MLPINLSDYSHAELGRCSRRPLRRLAAAAPAIVADGPTSSTNLERYERFFAQRGERSMISYLYDATGIALWVVVLLTVVTIYAALFSSISEAATGSSVAALKQSGSMPEFSHPFGPAVDGASLVQGPAAPWLRSYMRQTSVDCLFDDREGRCRLNDLVGAVDVLYVRSPDNVRYALGLIAYEADTGNAGVLRLVVGKETAAGQFETVASGNGSGITRPRIVGMRDGLLTLSGLTLGPRDARCCASDPTTYRISFSDGRLAVSLDKRIPLDGETNHADPDFTARARVPVSTTDTAASASATFYTMARARFVAAAGGRRNGADHVAVDWSRGLYQGESGSIMDHNGSDVMLFEHAGLIVYMTPKPSIAGVVRRGDVLFRGTVTPGRIDGYAYVFEAGCPASPYHVTGSRLSPDGTSDSMFKLRGAAPVHRRNSCEIVSYDAASQNARLSFGFVPGPDYIE